MSPIRNPFQCYSIFDRDVVDALMACWRTRRLFLLLSSSALGPLVGCGNGEGPISPYGTGGSASGGAQSGAGGQEQTGGAPSAGGSSTGGSSGGGAPALLSETGLFAPGSAELSAGVRSFSPRYELWSDGADKRRWIEIPPDSKIDTSDMDYWKFPPKTKIWKEFSKDGVRIETRLLEKSASGSWTMMAYLWREDESDADAAPNGVENARGTAHDVPAAALCAECHARVPDRILGFSAVQLSGARSDEDDLNLEGLEEGEFLTENPGPLSIPGTEVEQRALGYLHVNCGHCHNARSSVAGQVPMFLWLKADELRQGDVVETDTYKTTVGVQLTKGSTSEGVILRVSPGQPNDSALYMRMLIRGDDDAMPPLGTEAADAVGLDAVAAWIESLTP